MKIGITIAATLVMLVSRGVPSAAQNAKRGAADAIVGVWRIVEFCDDGSPDLHGRPWIGYFVYAQSGELSLQAMDVKAPVGTFADPNHPTLKELKGNNDAYFGYFGRWTLTSDSTVVHHVLGGTVPEYIGTDQLRYYRIRGDTLNIGEVKPLPCRVLVRVRNADAPG